MPTLNFDNTNPEHESFRYFHQQFEHMVGDYPERVALRFGSRISLKYHELNRESNQLAHYLCSQGVKAGDRVAIFFDKSPLQVIAVLACFKIGGLAIPLETLEELGEEGGQQHWRGEERLKEKFRVTQPKVVLTQSKHDPLLVQSLIQCEVKPQCLYLNALVDQIHQQRTDNLDLRLNPQSDPDAYIYFTSGSTGQPKAVLVGASGLLSRLLEAQKNLRITEQDVVGQFCPFDIDASLMEIMMALGSGACLDMIPPHIQSLTARLHEYFNSHGITLVPMVPSLHALLEPSKFRTLRVLITTGEDLTLKQLNRWQQGPSMQIICNGHGPTETTIALTFGIYWDKAKGVQSEMVHIGKPLQGTIVCLRDEGRCFIGREAEGELLIGGIGVAKGYLGQHDLTAEKFVTLAKSALPPSLPGWEQLPAELRFYCTGDRVQFNANGDMVFKGRVDQQQVKFSGIYTEKDEVAAILERSQAIKKATCRTDEGKMIATIQLSHEVEEDPSPMLRMHLARWMKRLPPIQFEFAGNWKGRSQVMVVAAEDPLLTLKTELKAIYEDVGICAAADIFDNETFDALGGTSLQATRLLRQLARRFPLIDVTDRMVFNRRLRVQRLAEYITQRNNPDLRTQKIYPIGLQADDASKPILFIIHSITGNAERDYAEIFQACKRFPYQVFAISAPGLVNPDATPETIELIAAQYLADIQARQPEGPYLIGGWSLGGVIAYEVGGQLQAQGELVSVMMLDSIAPFYLQQLGRQEYVCHMRWVVRALFRYYFNEELPDAVEQELFSPVFIKLDPISQTHQAMDILRLLVLVDELDDGLNEYLQQYWVKLYRSRIESPIASIELVRKIALAEFAYRPQHTVFCVDLVRAQEQYFPDIDAALGWGQRVGQIREVSGDHFAMLAQQQHRDLFFNIEQLLFRRSEQLNNFRLGEKVEVSQQWNLPQKNPKFTGRQPILQQLIAALKRYQAKPAQLVVSGMAGVGKTQCALSLAHTILQAELADPELAYDFVIWFSGQNMLFELADLARSQFNLCVEGYEGDALKKVVYRKLALQYRKILIMVDGADSESEIQPFLPAEFFGGCVMHTVITTCSESWHGIKPVKVQSFEVHEALQFVSQQLAVSIDESSTRLVKALHCYPLALSQAVAYIGKMPDDPGRIASFLQIFQEHQREILLKPAIAGDAYCKTVYGTWILVAKKLEAVQPKAVDLLRYCAYLSDQHIPIDLLCQLLSTADDEVSAFVFNEISLALREYSLVTVSAEVISVHQLLQMVIREDNQQKGRQQEILAKWLPLLDQRFNYDIADLSTYASSVYAPHVEALLAYIEGDISEGMYSLPKFNLYHRLATNCLYHQGREQKAMELWQTCLSQAKQYFGAGVGAPIIVECLIGIGRLLMGLCKYAEANESFAEALEILFELKGQEVELVRLFALLSRELAYWHFYQGDISKSKDEAQKALSKYQQPSEGAAEPDRNNRRNIAVIKVLFGQISCSEKQYPVAQRYLQEAMQIFTELYGRDAKHRNLALICDALGMIELLQAEYLTAIHHFEKGIEICEAVFGDAANHREFAAMLHHCGEAMVHHAMAAYVGSEQREKIAAATVLLQRSLQMKQKIFAEEPHPSVAVTLLKLGRLAMMSGDLELADRYLHQNLEIRADLSRANSGDRVSAYRIVEYVDALLELAVLNEQRYLVESQSQRGCVEPTRMPIDEHCNKALEALLVLQGTDIPALMRRKVKGRIVNARLKLGLFYLWMGDYHRAKGCYSRAFDGCESDISVKKQDHYRVKRDCGLKAAEILSSLEDFLRESKEICLIGSHRSFGYEEDYQDLSGILHLWRRRREPLRLHAQVSQLFSKVGCFEMFESLLNIERCVIGACCARLEMASAKLVAEVDFACREALTATYDRVEWHHIERGMVREARAARARGGDSYEVEFLYKEAISFLEQQLGLFCREPRYRSRSGVITYAFVESKLESVKFELQVYQLKDVHSIDVIKLYETGINAAERDDFKQAKLELQYAREILRISADTEHLLPKIYFALAAICHEQSTPDLEAKFQAKLMPHLRGAYGYKSKFRLFVPKGVIALQKRLPAAPIEEPGVPSAPPI